MVYANDRWLQMPVADLYDTLMMAMAINAAKDMYEKGLQLIKDFLKDYGDFSSPFIKDVQRHGLIIGGVRDVINNLYANGIDPLRSAEGRAAVAQAIRSVDPAEINAMRANAKTGYAYLDAMKQLAAKGKYDPDMQNAYLQSQGINTPFEEFATSGDNGLNSWTETSPIEAATLGELTEYGFKQRTPHEIAKEDAQRLLGKQYNPNAKYSGWIDRDLYDTSKGLIPGLGSDWRARYYRNRAAQRLGLDPNSTDLNVQNAIDNEFAKDIADANKRFLINPTGDLSDYYKERANALGWANYKLAKDKANKSDSGNDGKKKEELGMLSGIINTGYSMLSGTSNPGLWGRHMKPNLRNFFNTRYLRSGLQKKGAAADGLDVYNTKGFGKNSAGYAEMKNDYIATFGFKLNPQDFPQYTMTNANEKMEAFGITTLSPANISDLYSFDELMTHSYGYSGKRYTTNPTRDVLSKAITDGNSYDVIPSEEGVPVFNKHTKQIELYQKVNVKTDGQTPDYVLYRKINAASSQENDSGTNRTPVSKLDINERNINIARSVSNNLDLKYKAAQQKVAEDQISGSYTGYYDTFGFTPITDDYFYKQIED